MVGKLGIKGIAGVLMVVLGIGVIAWESPVIAAGMGLAVAGLMLVAWGIVSNALASFGFGGSGGFGGFGGMD